VIIQAATATTTSQPPGLFLLAWGLGASVIGLLTVTNFRGFAEKKYARQAEASRIRRRRRPRWNDRLTPRDPVQRTRQARLIAIPFAIAGPIVTVVGVFSIDHGQAGFSWPGAMASPFRYLVVAFAVAAAASYWISPRGLFRPAARRGGWRLALAVLACVCVLIFGIGMAMGQPTVVIAAWAIGGAAYLVLAMERRDAGPGPGPDGPV